MPVKIIYIIWLFRDTFSYTRHALDIVVLERCDGI